HQRHDNPRQSPTPWPAGDDQWCDPRIPALIKNLERPPATLAARACPRLLARQAADAARPRPTARRLLPPAPVAPAPNGGPAPAHLHRPRSVLPAVLGLRLPFPLHYAHPPAPAGHAPVAPVALHRRRDPDVPSR